MSSNSEMDTESAESSRSEESVRGRGRRRGGRRGGASGVSGRGRGVGGRGRGVGGRGRCVGGRGRGVGGRGRGVSGRGRGGLAMQVQPAESEQQRRDRVKELVANLIERCREVLCETIGRQPGLILDVLDRIEPAQPGFHPPMVVQVHPGAAVDVAVTCPLWQREGAVGTCRNISLCIFLFMLKLMCCIILNKYI